MIIVHGIDDNLVLFIWVYSLHIKWKRCVCLICFPMTSIPLWLLRHILLYWLSPRNSLSWNCIYSCPDLLSALFATFFWCFLFATRYRRFFFFLIFCLIICYYYLLIWAIYSGWWFFFFFLMIQWWVSFGEILSIFYWQRC